MTEMSRMQCSASEAETLLKSMWFVDEQGRMRLTSEANGDGRLGYTTDPRTTRPLAALGHPVGSHDNPLWEIARWMPTTETGCCGNATKIDGYHSSLSEELRERIYNLGLCRTALCKTFAFSIITPGDVDWISRLVGSSGIVEINAGRGYWARQLENVGVNVAAYDPHVPGDDNEYFQTPGTFTSVMRRDHTAVELHPDRVMLTVWPDYDGEYAAQALKLYRGDMVIYAGEGEGGCTASDEFFRILESDWEWLSSAPQHVSWYGIHCQLDAYVRKTKALTA